MDNIHKAILFIDSSTMFDTNAYSLIGTPDLAIIARNGSYVSLTI